MAKEHEPTLGLPAPFPSSPRRPPKYVVRFENEQVGLFYVTSFCELYAAKYPTALVLGERQWAWKDEKTIQCADGMVIHSDDLEEIIEHELTPKEEQWVPPPPYYGQWHDLAAGHSVRAQERSQTPKGSGSAEQRKKTDPKRTASKEGLVTISEIAEQLGRDPKQCRIALRKSGTPKPGASWAWPQDEADSIKAMILEHLRKS
jgi:hypothetical protein